MELEIKLTTRNDYDNAKAIWEVYGRISSYRRLSKLEFFEYNFSENYAVNFDKQTENYFDTRNKALKKFKRK
jgi:hypothetical protein